MLPAEVTSGTIQLNITDDLGGPKELKRFFRWNTPYLTYSFDLSFVQYFGIEGMDAVNEAFRVVNDFFEPEDKSYSGVSSMDFARDGFLSNYNTAWVNTTAQNEQIIDIKSIVLGMVVNHLGVGNPHRYGFTIRSISTNTTGTQCSMGMMICATIFNGLSTNMSNVWVTTPSVVFSTGTTPYSARFFSTSAKTSAIVFCGA